jgi:hypothetical protein
LDPKKVSLKSSKLKNQPPKTFWSTEGPTLLILSLSFLFCFRDWFSHFTSKVFLSLDTTFAYYPIQSWVHQDLTQGRIPLICDLVYHGAPMAAVNMVGVLSPLIWLFHGLSSYTLVFNIIFLAPVALYLLGTYFLGRRLGLSIGASLLLSFLWTYNGHQMAQLDHQNIVWAHSLFPWALLALARYATQRKPLWILVAALGLALNLLSGHPQVLFLEGLFLLFWIFLIPSTLSLAQKLGDLTALAILTFLVASPLILFTAECHFTDGFHFKWNETDRFFHSWTPLNFLTLLFPWFFGKEQFDRAGADYWWQYQFVEMQVAFSIAGLFFILLFFSQKHPWRRFITVTSLFGLSMALGKFFLVYPLIQKLPVFSFFRDPARYWFLVTWVVGLGAAFAWDAWFKEPHPHPRPLPSRERESKHKKQKPSPLEGEGRVRGDGNLFFAGRKLVAWIVSLSTIFIAAGWTLLTYGRPLLDGTASWLIQHFLLGDSLHSQPLAAYMARLPEKWAALSLNLDPRQPRVFLPLLFLAGLAAVVWNRKNWNLSFQKCFLLGLVFVDLMVFRMPLGQSFYDPSTLPAPAFAPAKNRSITLLTRTVSPLPSQYTEMAFPNTNLLFGRPDLFMVANPHLTRYDKILSDLGWFSWVYKDRDPLGFTRQKLLLYGLGIDQIVSDVPLKLPEPFRVIQNHYPFVYGFPAMSKVVVLSPIYKGRMLFTRWPTKLIPEILRWDETRVSVAAVSDKVLSPEKPQPDLLLLQKTALPGWKAAVNGRRVDLGFEEVLMTAPLVTGKNLVEFRFDPTGLRLGFFLFFLFFAVLTFFLLRRRTA